MRLILNSNVSVIKRIGYQYTAGSYIVIQVLLDSSFVIIGTIVRIDTTIFRKRAIRRIMTIGFGQANRRSYGYLPLTIGHVKVDAFRVVKIGRASCRERV